MVNYNTETEWTNLQGKMVQYNPIRYTPQDSGVRVGQVIVFNVILASGAKFSVAVGLAIAGFAMPYPPLQMFMIVTGCILTGILYFALRDEWEAQLDLLAQHIDKRRAPPPAPEQPKAPPQEIVIRKENATGYNERTIRVPNPPSAAFIVSVYRSQNANAGGRIPGERYFEGLFQDKADGWMSTLEELGIIEKVWPHETSPRRWTGALSLNQVLQAFGYEPEEVPAQLPPQPQTVRAQPPATPKIAEK